MKPLAIDLFCGLGGWADGLLAENWRVVGFDIERHVYGEHRYPAQLVLQDVLTLHGSQFKEAALIVASPPCQAYSYRAMPWKRAKALPPPDNTLFDACFRIQREACEAAGRHIPLIVENVRGAQKWVGRAKWNYGSFYLWGDVPALMPMTFKYKSSGMNWSDQTKRGQDFTRIAGEQAIKNSGGSWFAIAHNTTSGKGNNPDGRKGIPHRTKGHWTNPAEHCICPTKCDCQLPDAEPALCSEECPVHNLHPQPSPDCPAPVHRNGANASGIMTSSKSPKRKMASALIAKIPTELARHIARTFYPVLQSRAA